MYLGKNNISSTIELAMYRAKYYIYAHGSVDGDIMINNLNYAERKYYGRVDLQHRSVIPNIEKINGFTTNDKGAPAQALGFVGDNFAQMRSDIISKIAFNSMRVTSPSISAMVPYRTYESAIDRYNTYMRKVMTKFNTTGIKQVGSKNIMSFNDYVKYLMIYLSQTHRHGEPITLTGWNMSNLNSVFSTGLAISITGDNFENDAPKGEFIKSEMYTYFKKMALNKGFSILKNAPSVLVADLGSPVWRRRFERDGTALFSSGDGLSPFFDKYYSHTTDLDVGLLRKKIIDYYNDFVTLNKTERGFIIRPNKTLVTTKYRNNINYYNDTIYNNSNWIYIYLKLKNIETMNYINSHNMTTHKKRILKFDNRQALSYIEKVFLPYYFNKDWGHKDLKKRKNNKNKFLEKQFLEGKSSGKSSGGSSGGY